MTFSSSTAGAIILILLSYAIMTNAAYAQIFPNNQVNPAATPSPSPPSTSQQQQASQPKLHLVKITSPAKGQEVPAGKELTVSGTSVDNVTSSDCKVSVKVNGINPYHDASGNGGPGKAGYSKWNFTLTSAYTNIQPGPNKITAKFSCSNNPVLLSHNSVNVTGVAATDVAAINNNSSQQEQISSTATPTITTANSTSAATATADTNHISSDTNFSTNVNNNNNDNNIKPLSVSVHLGKNSLHPGDKTITLSVADKNSSAAISGASVSGKITGPSGTIKKVEGTTDDKGKASYSWKVHNDYATGKYKVKIEVSDPGYENYSGSKSFKVTPIPVTISNHISIKSNSDNSPAHIIVPGFNVDSLSTSDNVNKHNHIHHHNHSTIISSFSPDTIPNNNLIPQAVSPNTNTNTETEDLHHPSTIIPSTSDNTEGNTNINNDLQASTSIGVKNNNDMSSNSLSGSTIAGNNLGIHIGNLAQKIINDVKNKLEKQGINIH